MNQTTCSSTCDPTGHELVNSLRALAVRALARMYLPQQQLFAFHLRRDGQGIVYEGVSRRYTATVLIALARESREIADQALCGQSSQAVCMNLISQLPAMTDPGEVALTLWAARALRLPEERAALARLSTLWNQARWPTVETAWALSALCEGSTGQMDDDLARQAAQRLMGCFRTESELFAHWPEKGDGPLLRRHVTCFADFVYPVQALSFYSRATGTQEPLDIASRCAQRMCRLQGVQGQWWWHFDVRTNRVVEQYPVYSVHQDAMAPMALRAVRDAGGPDLMKHADRGLAWLAKTPELDGASLVDPSVDVIWRKVARHEPGKLARGIQATASRIHPALRVPGLGLVLRPGRIDYESRPYHMGWILYAWPTSQEAAAKSSVSPSASAVRADVAVARSS